MPKDAAHDMHEACVDAAQALESLFSDKIKAASDGDKSEGEMVFVDSPHRILKAAKGVVVLHVKKVGVLVSFKTHSHGVLVVRRQDGGWSAPCAISAGTFGFGFMFGMENIYLILVLNTVKAVEAFGSLQRIVLNDHISVSAFSSSDASFYSWINGAFVGIGISSRIELKIDQDLNKQYYEADVTTNDIFNGSVKVTPDKTIVADVLDKYLMAGASKSSLQLTKTESGASLSRPTTPSSPVPTSPSISPARTMSPPPLPVYDGISTASAPAFKRSATGGSQTDVPSRTSTPPIEKASVQRSISITSMHHYTADEMLVSCSDAAAALEELFSDKVRATSGEHGEGDNTFVDSPYRIIKSAKGVCVLHVKKVGVVLSIKTESHGVLVVRRPDNTWSAPCAISTGRFGFGFMLGKEDIYLILVLNTQKAVEAFSKQQRVVLNDHISVSAFSSSDASFYSWTGGAFVGFGISARLVLQVNKEVNRLFYNKEVPPEEIFAGAVEATEKTKVVADVLEKYLVLTAPKNLSSNNLAAASSSGTLHRPQSPEAKTTPKVDVGRPESPGDGGSTTDDDGIVMKKKPKANRTKSTISTASTPTVASVPSTPIASTPIVDSPSVEDGTAPKKTKKKKVKRVASANDVVATADDDATSGAGVNETVESD